MALQQTVGFSCSTFTQRRPESFITDDMAALSLDTFPAELQLIIFGFAYSDCQINIAEHKSWPQRTATTTTTASRPEHTLISKALYGTAWQAYLKSATWSFDSIAAIQDFIKTPPRPAVVRHIRHIRVDVGKTDAAALLGCLYQARCAIRSVEVAGCTAYDLGVPQPADTGALCLLHRDETDVIQSLLNRSCQATDVTKIVEGDLEQTRLVQALIRIPTLECVVLDTGCELCTEFDIDCDWSLVARKAEVCVLQAVAGSGTASRTRMRNIARIEAEIEAREDAVLSRDGLECIDACCGADWEMNLETDEELEVLVG